MSQSNIEKGNGCGPINHIFRDKHAQPKKGYLKEPCQKVSYHYNKYPKQLPLLLLLLSCSNKDQPRQISSLFFLCTPANGNKHGYLNRESGRAYQCYQNRELCLNRLLAKKLQMVKNIVHTVLSSNTTNRETCVTYLYRLKKAQRASDAFIEQCMMDSLRRWEDLPFFSG